MLTVTNKGSLKSSAMCFCQAKIHLTICAQSLSLFKRAGHRQPENQFPHFSPKPSPPHKIPMKKLLKNFHYFIQDYWLNTKNPLS
nr:hypothetical protein [uncultured Kingella sp.]